MIPYAVEEMLRYVRIAKAILERVATEDVELSGVTVRAGSTVIPLQYSANRDEALTDDPDRFDITRKHVPHAAYGGGTHFCLGAPLARLELLAAFEGKHVLLTRGPVVLPVTW